MGGRGGGRVSRRRRRGCEGRRRRPKPRWSQFTRITEAAGEETSPTLSPDGSTVAYSTRVNGSWDIYSQRVGGRNATPIVNDPQRDEGGAAVLARRLADRVSRVRRCRRHLRGGRDGRIGAAASPTSGSIPRGRPTASRSRLAPKRSTTQRRASARARSTSSPPPAARRGRSSTATRRSRRGLRRASASSTGATPAVSATSTRSRRPAARAVRGHAGRRDRLVAGVVARRTLHLLLERSRRRDEPVADRRRSIERTPAGRAGAGDRRRAGRRPGFRASRGTARGWCSGRASPRSTRSPSRSIRRPCAPATPFVLDTQNNIRVPSDVSPDGKQIAYFSIGERQEDIFVGPPDGPMRRITDDAPRDRGAGVHAGRPLAHLLFESGRHWGAGRSASTAAACARSLIPAGGAVYPFVSPKGDTIVFVGDDGRSAFTAPVSPRRSVATHAPAR